MARERLKKPKRVGSILSEVLDRMGLTRGLKCQNVLSLWPVVVGKEICRRAQAYDIQDGVLLVQVSDNTWMQELYFLKSVIIKKLNDKIGETLVKDIRFRLRS